MEGALSVIASAKNKLVSAGNIVEYLVTVEVTDSTFGKVAVKAFTLKTIEYIHHAVCAIVRGFMVDADGL